MQNNKQQFTISLQLKLKTNTVSHLQRYIIHTIVHYFVNDDDNLPT